MQIFRSNRALVDKIGHKSHYQVCRFNPSYLRVPLRQTGLAGAVLYQNEPDHFSFFLTQIKNVTTALSRLSRRSF